jgi:hypothetical protein
MRRQLSRSDLPRNRAAGAQLLGVLALSHSTFRAALERANTLHRVQLSLHECQRLTMSNDAWKESLDSMRFLQATLSDLSSVWFDVERWLRPGGGDLLSIWQHVASSSYRAMLQAKLEYASSCPRFDDLTHQTAVHLIK